MSTTISTRDPYLVKSLVHASQVLAVFQFSGETLRLRDIATRSGLNKGMVFRLLYTLERCGMVEKVGDNQYQSCVRPLKQKRYRLGYAAQGTDYQFSKDVSEGLRDAAAAEGIEVISVDNRYSAATAQRNAELLIREKVDLMIEFQTDEMIAPIIAAKFREANIPLIAIDIPHPGATYFGANNYGAGLIGGRYLGRWAKQHWQGNMDEIVFLELPRAGSLPRMRLTGMLVGMKETLPSLDSCPVTYIDGDGQFGHQLRGGAQVSAVEAAVACAAGRHQRRERPGRNEGVPGSGLLGALCRDGPERLARSSRRAARSGDPHDRIGGLFPRAVRTGTGARRPGPAEPESGAARGVHQASPDYAGDGGSLLSQRFADVDRAGIVSDAMKTFEDIAGGVAEGNRAAVRTAHGA